MTGEFLTGPNGVTRFEHIAERILKRPDLDAKGAFATAAPGVLGMLTQMSGAWNGRETQRWEIPGVTQGGRAVGPDERMATGEDDVGHIAAQRGFEIAGYSMRVGKQDFDYGGMSTDTAMEMARKPVLNFNDQVAKGILMNVLTSGDYAGAVADNFAWSTLDQKDNTQSADLAAQSARVAADVYANGTQTFEHWTLRDGTKAAAGHDHIAATGVAWTPAGAKASADNILEHPGNGRVIAFVDTLVAEDVHADLTTSYANNGPLQGFIEGDSALLGANFAGASRIGVRAGIDYWHMPDMAAAGAVFVAAGKKPLHLHVGAKGGNGAALGTGGWLERGNPETQGTTYGFRDFVSAGVRDPLAIAYDVFA